MWFGKCVLWLRNDELYVIAITNKLLRLCAFARKTTRHCEALRAIAHNVKYALKQSQHHYVAKF
jgi:hypothetical protein